MKADTRHLALPFFDDAHRALGDQLAAWAPAQQVDESDDRRACKQWVRLLGDAGWLRYCVPASAGGAMDKLDSRALVILRETLAFHSPLADFAFAMQGLGSGAITLAGTPAHQAAYLPAVARGDKIAAFALSEPDAGSDAGAMTTSADTSDGGWALNGSKTWISNGDIADFYVTFAKTDREAGTRGITAFIVDAGNPGLDSSEHIAVMAPHPLATLKFSHCKVSGEAQLGALNGGFKLAMQTLDIFRASVAAAALGMARRALFEAVRFSRERKMFGQTLADFQLTQAKIGEMAALIDAAALLTYRAAWLRDDSEASGAGKRITAEAAMAKMTATENAQRVIDMALQMHGGLGVKVGTKVESLYRDIRSLRIYEGATEVQQLIIGKAVLQS
ncbi:MAG: acyl-CoA dehydrogenase family protein [Polaromonas sp.]|uniref:acyl-CoA dehydrogenase family protein n=1 Tax=Polaromonas sp. TaxID=1869339 RepID=UPI002731ACA5|nr:acyl-CoA dehydrogenase family protein [Polaromonas sp.]MDP2448057.1 acyl-CoA dehydrogenase family protein [Polaromonas sp.]MDP3249300.1 acyl-CoA dehydrogenase family protein [Polaromonas sp.]MDP3755266.1 acyl-CoA dehydrogenase family protein [Polaromonas sp.]